jgi:hypothetical protein
MSMRKLAAAAALSVAAGIGVVAFAGVANAQSAPSTGTIRQSTNAYSAPHSESPATILGLQPGQKTTILCYTEGETVHNNDYWFRIGQGATTGFVPREVIVPDGYVDHC